MGIPVTFADIVAAGPISVMFIAALVVLIVESILRNGEPVNRWLALAGFLAAGAVAALTTGWSGLAFGGTVHTGGFASYCALVFSIAGALSVLLSSAYLKKTKTLRGEYYALLLIAVFGMMLMGAANDLVVFFLGLETMSIPFYVLAAFARNRATSNEAGLKYFLLGAFATGFLLYGIALIYGTTGTTNIATIRQKVPGLVGTPIFTVGLGMLLTGLMFKIAAVPFHMWAPDVYEGAPTPVSGFMATGGKAAAFAVFLIIFAPTVLWSAGVVREILALVAAASMILGNIAAIAQTSIKRMLAYSSIAHAGYILVGVVAANAPGGNGVLFYILAYTLMNIGAFGVLGMLEKDGGENLSFEDCAGLGKRTPLLAFMMAVFMFSLAGIPPFAGFFGKYYVFVGAIQAGYTWLAIVGVIMSVVSAYYYLRLVVMMYFTPESEPRLVTLSSPGVLALGISIIALIYLGLFPSTIIDVTSRFF
jgi:NADH-quinone oxidoreductase subunit N